jgi:putative effector of murein hydrolase
MNPNDLQIAEIWVYLSGSPLFALILTLTAYQVGSFFYQKTERPIQWRLL